MFKHNFSRCNLGNLRTIRICVAEKEEKKRRNKTVDSKSDSYPGKQLHLYCLNKVTFTNCKFYFFGRKFEDFLF